MNPENKTIHIVGAGLAGSECAFQLAEMGHKVVLHEMRGVKMTPAHKTTDFAELVCSNSFGSFSRFSAPGQMKWEAEQLGSKILELGFETRVPAGQALGMDREEFARRVTEALTHHPRIQIVREVVHSLNDLPRPLIVATGPLTDEPFAKSLQEHFGNEFLYFFDAIAPIVDRDSLDDEKIWRADRFDKGTGDYLNCPMDRDQYYQFINEIKLARKVESKEFEKTPYFESCMPIEEIIRRGDETLRFGPLSPKGLRDPRTGQRPYAVVQLRQDNKIGSAYNMVGFQTKMAYPEQKRIFSMIPGLEKAEFLKLGSIHRNLYIDSPRVLNTDFSSKTDPWLFFAGQITGVEGYFDSTCMGLLVSRFLDKKLKGERFIPPPLTSALGALHYAITQEVKDNFQPTNINFGLLPASERRLPKTEKRAYHTLRARRDFKEWVEETQPWQTKTIGYFDALAEALLSDEDRQKLMGHTPLLRP